MYRYETIAKELIDGLSNGKYTGGRLPSERALMDSFGVQRSTIRRALATLRSHGIIEVAPNRRPFVKELDPTAFERKPLPTSGNILFSVETIRESTARFDIEMGLHQALSDLGYGVIHHDPVQSPFPTPERIAQSNIIAAVIWAHMPASRQSLQRLKDALPLVLVDRRIAGFGSDFVGFDDEAGGRGATDHLLSLGHRRIGFLSGEVGAETVSERWRGYSAALVDADVMPEPEWILHLAHMRQMSVEMSHQYLESFISQSACPLTAVVCASDSTAAILIGFLRATGRSVPGDVSVIGFGDLLPDYLRAIGLTTMAQTFTDVGCNAAQLLIARLAENSPDGIYREIRLPMRLVVRSSSAAAPSPG